MTNLVRPDSNCCCIQFRATVASTVGRSVQVTVHAPVWAAAALVASTVTIAVMATATATIEAVREICVTDISLTDPLFIRRELGLRRVDLGLSAHQWLARASRVDGALQLSLQPTTPGAIMTAAATDTSRPAAPFVAQSREESPDVQRHSYMPLVPRWARP